MNKWYKRIWIKLFVARWHWQALILFLFWCNLTIMLSIWEASYVKIRLLFRNSDVIMGAMASQITSLTIVHSFFLFRRRSIKSLAFERGIHHWPVNSPHKWSVTRKMSPFEDVVCSNKVNPQQNSFETKVAFNRATKVLPCDTIISYVILVLFM